MLRIAIGSDHADFDYKTALIEHLKSHNIKDFGPSDANSVDYPDFAHPVADGVAKGNFDFGIPLCGSANGVALPANKHSNVRAGICCYQKSKRLFANTTMRISFVFQPDLYL